MTLEDSNHACLEALFLFATSHFILCRCQRHIWYVSQARILVLTLVHSTHKEVDVGCHSSSPYSLLHIITEFRSFSSKLNYFKMEREDGNFSKSKRTSESKVQTKILWMWNTENNGLGVISESNIHIPNSSRERLHLLYFRFAFV